ncbi:MAG: hypothetical protein JOZ41_10610 [Chloroflexi bacterium]|nr:hypothetical protein [Chloroflexota bacterium]
MAETICTSPLANHRRRRALDSPGDGMSVRLSLLRVIPQMRYRGKLLLYDRSGSPGRTRHATSDPYTMHPEKE